MKGLLRRLGSLKLTVWILVALTIVFLSGMLIPQKTVLQRDLYLEWKESAPTLVSALDTLGLTSVYTSPVIIGLWVLFFVNLGLVMWRRVGTVRALIAVHPGKLRKIEAVRRGRPNVEIRVPRSADGTATVGRFFARHRFRVLTGQDGLYAVKNRLSPVATLVFHLSFFLILVGGVVSFYSRFTGSVDLARGEIFTGDFGQYRRPPRVPVLAEPPRTHLELTRVEPQVERNTPVGIRAVFTDRQGGEHVVEINRPYRDAEGTSFVIQDLGVAPLVVLLDRDGREIDGAWVKLDVLQGAVDRFQIADWEFSALFYPDFVLIDGKEATRSAEFNNPAFRIVATDADNRVAFDRTIRPGESLEFDDVRLEMPEMRFWVRFYVRRESGLGLVWTGFGLASLGLIWRLVFYRREYWAATAGMGESGSSVSLTGRSEFFKALFEEEFEATVERLRAHVAEEGSPR